MNRQITQHLSSFIQKLCSIILVGLLLAACTPETQVAEVGPDFNVKRDLDHAWATLTDPLQFDQLNDPDWKDIIQDGLVTTDNIGQAQLCPYSSINPSGDCSATEACHIFVFWDSTLKYSSCSEGSSNGVCNYDGTQAFRNCDISVQTLSADVQGLGTWFSVTYLRESQITLVILGEGKVEVTPVSVLNLVPTEKSALMSGEEPPMMDFQITQRQMGEPQAGEIDPGSGQLQVYYTAPAVKLKELGLTGLPTNQWLDIGGLNILRERLHLEEPNLDPWLRSVWQVAPQDGVKLPPLEPLAPTTTGLVVTGFNILANTAFGEMLGYGVDWTMLDKEFLGSDNPVTFNGATQFQGQFNQLSDMRRVGYDPSKAMELVKENGYDKLTLMLLVPPDDALQTIAKLVQRNLSEFGFQVEFIVVPVIDIPTKVQSLLDQGAQVLVMNLG